MHLYPFNEFLGNQFRIQTATKKLSVMSASWSLNLTGVLPCAQSRGFRITEGICGTARGGPSVFHHRSIPGPQSEISFLGR